MAATNLINGVMLLVGLCFHCLFIPCWLSANPCHNRASPQTDPHPTFFEQSAGNNSLLTNTWVLLYSWIYETHISAGSPRVWTLKLTQFQHRISTILLSRIIINIRESSAPETVCSSTTSNGGMSYNIRVTPPRSIRNNQTADSQSFDVSERSEK